MVLQTGLGWGEWRVFPKMSWNRYIYTTIILGHTLTDNPALTDITLWSDSCVPQNRNKIMATALMLFLKTSSLESITQKFCEPGHSEVQEVDNLHSQIDRVIQHQILDY